MAGSAANFTQQLLFQAHQLPFSLAKIDESLHMLVKIGEPPVLKDIKLKYLVPKLVLRAVTRLVFCAFILIILVLLLLALLR